MTEDRIMRNRTIIISALLLAAAASSCKVEQEVEFAIEGDSIEIDAQGGTRNVKISSPGEWIATTNVPWITVSPANGRGSELCQIIIDSSVVFTSEDPVRKGVVRIETGADLERREISVTQKNFPYQITLDDKDVSIPNFEDKDDRWFEVTVKANSEFRVEPEYAVDAESGIIGDWLEVEKEDLVLDRGARPRNVKVKFKWDINSVPEDRSAKVNFVPVDSQGNDMDASGFSQIDLLNVVQTAAERIKENSREGDSTALVGISRALGVWSAWDPSIPMDRWENVELWDSEDDALHGRVKSVTFFMYSTDDYIPFQVQYLTAAEEIVFYSNENSFNRDNIEIGPYLPMLGGENSRLKRLTISAHGLEDLPADLASLKNLEYLDVSSNNFRKIPDVLTKENFPKLHALLLNTNQRRLVYDLSNVSVDESGFSDYYGGLYDENNRAENQMNGSTGRGFPLRFLQWEELDTLYLSVNYLSGTLPSDEELLAAGFEPYSQADYDAQDKDTLATYLLENGVPKVIPNMKKLAINLNRFTGALPDWVLYHPNLDFWDPLVLVFNQEGKNRNGESAGFTNAPDNLEYYYIAYPNKYYSPTRTDNE